MPHFTKLAALSLLGLTAALPMAAAEPVKLSVVLGYVVNAENFSTVYAAREGLFAQEGLDVTVIPAGAGVDQVQMLATGQAQIGLVGPEQIFAGIDKGEDMTIFAAQFQRTPVAMTCSQASGVTKPAELVGKKLGLKTNFTANGELFLAKNQLSRDDVEIISIGSTDIAMLVSGNVDCMLTTFAFNEPRMIESLGVPVNVISVGDYGMNAQINSYFTTTEFFNAEGNKDVLERFLRAEAKAWEVFYKDPAAAAQYILESGLADGLELEQQVYQAEKMLDYMSSDLTREKGLLWIDTTAAAQADANALEAGLISKPIDLDKVLSFEILEAVKPAKL